MIDIQVRRVIDPYMDLIGYRLATLGIRANVVTWFGFIAGICGSFSIFFEYYAAGFLLIVTNRLCDGLDGCIARYSGPTDLGGFLDIALDMIFYSSVPFAFAAVEPANSLPAAFLIYSFIGTGSSFLAYAIIALKRGQSTDTERKKSFFYSIGLIEGTETAIFLLLVCLIPKHFPECAWVFGSLCWITTAIRIAGAYRAFNTA